MLIFVNIGHQILKIFELFEIYSKLKILKKNYGVNKNL